VEIEEGVNPSLYPVDFKLTHWEISINNLEQTPVEREGFSLHIIISTSCYAPDLVFVSNRVEMLTASKQCFPGMQNIQTSFRSVKKCYTKYHVFGEECCFDVKYEGLS